VLLKTINSVIILGLIFRFPFGLVRILLSLLAELFLAEGRDRTGFVITILALYRSWMVCSTSFLIPLGLRFMNLFIRKQRRVATSWLLITVQLYFYGYCDLVSVLSFGLFRSLSGIMYGLALVCSFMPWRFAFDLSLILSLREKLPAMMLNGRISLLVIALGWVFIYRLSLGGKERYFGLLALLLVGNHYQSIFHPFWEVTFLDVGQGDCAVISRPFSDCGLLIDTGGNYYKDVGNDLVIPYLRSRGLNMVDVIISHDDYDHSGALGSLVRNYRVGRIYIDKEDVSFGNLTVRALLPEYQWEESNDNSLINYFTIDSIGFLFTGDISETVEEELTQQYSGLKVTVLKVAHHGSALSTGTRLLSEIRPYFAVISAGRNNRYGHPAAETLQRLADWNVRVFNTQNHHAVRFTVIKHMMIYRCAGGLAGIFLP
ncbi:MAG: MBL fold metallo-hydrolase, partial [Erysipelotrichaceae bacterium]|nr:MBL fold metallo-hydrolase [Erysipelotrichaceae bacterium]